VLGSSLIATLSWIGAAVSGDPDNRHDG
jgi:hypothetical protein